MAQEIRKTSERLPEHDIITGEHAANDRHAIDWAAYHANTPQLRIKRHAPSEAKNEKIDR